MLDQEKSTVKTNALFEKKDRVGNTLSNWRNKKVLPLIKGELLDVACGDNRLVKLHGSGRGADIKNYGSVDIVVPDLSKLPLEDNSIDTATIVGCLNYFHEPVGVLKEVNRVLKNDGQLILTMSNAVLMKIWHTFRDPWAYRPSYSDRQVRELLNQANFKLTAKIPFMCFLNFIYIAHK